MTQSQDAIRKSNLIRVVYLGFCFTLLFTGYFAAANLMTQVFKQLNLDGLGQISFFSICFAFAATAFIAPNYYTKISMNLCFSISSSFYALFIATGLLAAGCDKYELESSICGSSFLYIINVITALLLGAAAPFLWLSQAKYINACADDQSRGMFNGTFMSLFNAAQITSSLIATIVLGSFDQFTYYFVILLFGIAAVVMFLFVKDPIPYNETNLQAKTAEPHPTLKEGVQGVLKALAERKYTFLFMAILFYGIATAFYGLYLGTSVSITIESIDPNEVNRSTGIVFLSLALFEVLAGLSIGKLADKYDKILLLNVVMFINEGAILLTILACISKNFYFAIIAGALWGYGDAGMSTMINVIIGSCFGANPKLFAAYRCVSCVGNLIFTVLALSLTSIPPILFLLMVTGLLLGFHALFFSYLRYTDIKKSDKEVTASLLEVEMKELMK